MGGYVDVLFFTIELTPTPPMFIPFTNRVAKSGQEHHDVREVANATAEGTLKGTSYDLEKLAQLSFRFSFRIMDLQHRLRSIRPRLTRFFSLLQLLRDLELLCPSACPVHTGEDPGPMVPRSLCQTSVNSAVFTDEDLFLKTLFIF